MATDETDETNRAHGADKPSLLSYRVICEIARGGMADVFLGEIDFPDKPGQCAIKYMRPEQMSRYASYAFLREGMLGYDLSNDNRGLVRTLHYGIEPGGRPVILMERVGGPPVRDARDALRGKWALIRRIARDVLVTLGKMHELRVIHRDVSAGNILLDNNGRVLLCDLGMARPEFGEHTKKPRITVPYASPEYLRGAPATRASDLYSLGAVLYEIITGATPYDANAIRALADMERRKPIGPLPEDTPDDLGRLIPWMLELTPDDRPSTHECVAFIERSGQKIASDNDIFVFVDAWIDSLGIERPPPADIDKSVARFLKAIERYAGADAADADAADGDADAADADAADADESERRYILTGLTQAIFRVATDESSRWDESVRQDLLNSLAEIREMVENSDEPGADPAVDAQLRTVLGKLGANDSSALDPSSGPGQPQQPIAKSDRTGKPPDAEPGSPESLPQSEVETAAPADPAAYARLQAMLRVSPRSTPRRHSTDEPADVDSMRPISHGSHGSHGANQHRERRRRVLWALLGAAAALLLGYLARDLQDHRSDLRQRAAEQTGTRQTTPPAPAPPRTVLIPHEPERRDDALTVAESPHQEPERDDNASMVADHPSALRLKPRRLHILP